MFYRFGITTPANTAEEDKIETILPLARGVIHHVAIHFPPGPKALTHVQLKRGIHQIWPSNIEESFGVDNLNICFNEHYEIIDRPFQIEAWCWNEDDTYDHLVIIRIGILARKFVLRRLF